MPVGSYASVALVLPARDEALALPHTLRGLPAVGWVVVVDNGSRDDTADVARRAGAVVVHEPRRGYGLAVQAGWREARRLGAQVVVVVDADGAVEPGDVLRVAAPVVAGEADLVLGDRTAGAAPGALTRAQRWGHRLATVGLRLTVGRRFGDLGPLRAARVDLLERLALSDPNFGWNVEMQAKAVRAGCRVVELPVGWHARRAGQSKISGDLRAASRAGLVILEACLRYGRWRPPASTAGTWQSGGRS